MDRLTYYYNGKARMNIGDTCYAGHIPDKLAAYEDTGLSPEEIKRNMDDLDKYRKAEAEGRLIVPPCKVGDTVYWVREKAIIEVYIRWFETNAYGWCACGTYPPLSTRTFRFADFGKIVFLTREKAEKHLTERNS